MLPKLPLDLERIAKDAEAEIGSTRVKLFSPDGFARLNERIADYIGELTMESVRVARRHQSDSVSPSYVDRAAEHLATGKSARWRKITEGLGSIILGIGLATAGSMVQTGVFSTNGVIISVGCIVVGMPAFLFHFIRE